jgi:hypothetical protein
MSLRLAPEPRTAGQQLAGLLTANHADGPGAACERPVDQDAPGAAAKMTAYQRMSLVAQADGWWCDSSYDGHGLTWWYPKVVDMVGVRNTGGRRGSGGAVAVPIDLGALDFLAGKYWALDEPPTERTIDDPDSYRTGFTPTVIGLEQSARTALGLERRLRRRHEGYDGVSADPRVLEALAWIAAHADNIVAEAPQLAATIKHHANRLRGRAMVMLLGSRFEATVNECMYCEQLTVIADEDRAVCRNPDCRRPDGARRCWRLLEPEPGAELTWTEVDEPDVRGRGRLSEEQLPRWTETG